MTQQTTLQKNSPLVITGFIFAFFMPIVGLILSIIGLAKQRKTGAPTGLAVAGVVISSIALVLSIFLIGAVTSFVMNDFSFQGKTERVENNRAMRESVQASLDAIDGVIYVDSGFVVNGFTTDFWIDIQLPEGDASSEMLDAILRALADNADSITTTTVRLGQDGSEASFTKAVEALSEPSLFITSDGTTVSIPVKWLRKY